MVRDELSIKTHNPLHARLKSGNLEKQLLSNDTIARNGSQTLCMGCDAEGSSLTN